MQPNKVDNQVYLQISNISKKLQAARWRPNVGNMLFSLMLVAGLVWGLHSGMLELIAAPNAQPVTSINTIPYQGRLANTAGDPLTDTIDMSFRLYNTANGGAPLWTEQWVGSSAVQVSDGLFNVMLGSLNPIDTSVMTDNSSLFLGVTVATDNEMTPRVQIGSVPLAVQALTVPNGSITSEKLADGAVTADKLDAESTFRLLGEKSCHQCGNVDEPSLVSWHPVKGQDVNDLIEVTATTNGGKVLVTMNARYSSSLPVLRWCGIYVYRDGELVQRVHTDGLALETSDWSCSSAYLFTDLPAGTYTFSAQAWLGAMADVTWSFSRQISVFEF
ncbi:MAG: hypothetical protein AAF639_16710 [Chloroflexota bacterium]